MEFKRICADSQLPRGQRCGRREPEAEFGGSGAGCSEEEECGAGGGDGSGEVGEIM